jgi:hypothetical protein
MKKLFLILLIAILAVSDAHHPFESNEERSWEDKVNNFLEYIESYCVLKFVLVFF